MSQRITQIRNDTDFPATNTSFASKIQPLSLRGLGAALKSGPETFEIERSRAFAVGEGFLFTRLLQVKGQQPPRMLGAWLARLR